jgi:hypothetical protein
VWHAETSGSQFAANITSEGPASSSIATVHVCRLPKEPVFAASVDSKIAQAQAQPAGPEPIMT